MSSLALGTVLAAVAFEAPHAVVVSRVGFAERTRAPCLCADPRSMSWQEGLESFLSPSTAQADREVLFKDLLNRGPEIADEVREAVQSGQIDTLLSPNQSKQLDDLKSVQRQIEEDILPQAVSPQFLQEVAASAAREAQEARPPDLAALTSFLSDPARAFELLQQEAKNIGSRVPDGLEKPPYVVLTRGENFEVREYESYGIALTEMADDESTLLASSRSFRALASFIFGGNAREENVEMTTPVRTDVAPGEAVTMAFALPRKYSAATAPAPADPTVRLQQVEMQTLAVAEFAGFATDGEVSRQRSHLVGRLESAGVEMVGGGERYAIFQYNPPYTLPWLRSNEIAIPVVRPVEMQDTEADSEAVSDAPAAGGSEVMADEAPSADAAQGGVAMEEGVYDDSAPSDMDE